MLATSLAQVPRDALNSLGLAKAPADTRVVVAMSGGVDLSVVAAMLADEGYDVVGVTMQLYDHGEATHRKGACCAGRTSTTRATSPPGSAFPTTSSITSSASARR